MLLEKSPILIPLFVFFIYIQSTDKNEIEFIKQAANNALIAQEMLHSLAMQHVFSMEYGFLYNTNKK